ncbi:glycosyltransferase [Singulisphaera sp. GP187]|uniref:glycosyltransferase n=1 Tax=Singulisphaera sp. GP187 TaxID=1882752 RepID=UPI001356714A
MLKAIVDEHRVTFVALHRQPVDLEAWELQGRFEVPPILSSVCENTALTDQGRRLRDSVRKHWWLRPDSIANYDIPSLWNTLGSLDLSQFDVIHLRWMFLAPYALAIKALMPQIKLVVDIDDILSLSQYRNVRFRPVKPFSRYYYTSWLDVLRYHLFESATLPFLDSMWVCSARDREYLARRADPSKIHVVPNGADVASLARLVPDFESCRLTLVGDYGNPPNAHAAINFVQRTWPLIQREFPAVELWLVGSAPNKAVQGLHDEAGKIFVTGLVPEVTPYLEATAVSIAPIMFGTGTRLKIIEAMAAGLPVVSTTAAAEGIDFEGHDVARIADQPAEFARACLDFLKHPELRRSMGERARKFVKARYDWSAIRNDIAAIYRTI